MGGGGFEGLPGVGRPVHLRHQSALLFEEVAEVELVLVAAGLGDPGHAVDGLLEQRGGFGAVALVFESLGEGLLGDGEGAEVAGGGGLAVGEGLGDGDRPADRGLGVRPAGRLADAAEVAEQGRLLAKRVGRGRRRLLGVERVEPPLEQALRLVELLELGDKPAEAAEAAGELEPVDGAVGIPVGEVLDEAERLAVGVLRAGASRGLERPGEAAEVGRLQLAVAGDVGEFVDEGLVEVAGLLDQGDRPVEPPLPDVQVAQVEVALGEVEPDLAVVGRPLGQRGVDLDAGLEDRLGAPP